MHPRNLATTASHVALYGTLSFYVVFNTTHHRMRRGGLYPANNEGANCIFPRVFCPCYIQPSASHAAFYGPLLYHCLKASNPNISHPCYIVASASHAAFYGPLTKRCLTVPNPNICDPQLPGFFNAEKKSRPYADDSRDDAAGASSILLDGFSEHPAIRLSSDEYSLIILREKFVQ